MAMWRGVLPVLKEKIEYEAVSNIFRTGAAIYIAVVIVRSTSRW